ncbi:glycoside hydrolase family 26 protein [Microlunatus soli]|uniref:Glycosyl hydrolase family 26 n=1 Tax=Microlunatus soli TaxID=630515 RepID=A0A1H1WCF5_9ACTN|nr:glycosyl hydrolase [Microlunatus soli]SDS94672.1 Glycosyl hydrolase family 26 [Microlunatus soli]
MRQAGIRSTLLMAVIVLSVLVAGCGAAPAPDTRVPSDEPVPSLSGDGPGLQRARRLLGPPPSGGAWHSGVWPGGGTISAKRANAFGVWRGTPIDTGVTYPATDSWQQIQDSSWHIQTYNGLDGVLAYGLPMLPDNDTGDFRSIVRGDHDEVYRQIADDLIANDRGRSIVRIGWEANGDWFPWNVRADQAAEYIAAFRHIVGVLRGTAPDLVIDFDIACGTTLRGQQNRTDALTKLYPGDDVVDLVGCDIYDWYGTAATDQAGWRRSLRPQAAVGIADVADFARDHGKGLTFPEWGLASPAEHGAGDNPYFIERMRSFFDSQASTLVMENYFNEPDTSLANSIWEPAQMPRAAQAYRRLW